MWFLKKWMNFKEKADDIKEVKVSETQFENMLSLLNQDIVSGKDIIKLGKISPVCDAFGMMDKMDNEQCTQMLKALTKYISDFKRIHYIYIYQRFRNYQDLSWYKNFTPLLLRNLYSLNLTLEEKITLLGLASFHSNGYFRQMATEELIKLNHSDGLKFILIRCSDYVDAIRNIASNYVIDYITYENMPYVIKNIDFIQYIRIYERCNNNQLFESIHQKINTFYYKNSSGMTTYLIKGLKSEKQEVEEYCINELVTRDLLSIGEAIELIKTLRNRIIIVKLANLIVNRLTIQELLDLKEITVKTKLHKTQMLIIEKLYHLGYYTNYTMLLGEAVSPYGCIRGCTQYVIKKIGDIDIKVLYKKLLEEATATQNNKIKQYALIEIGELADKEDIPLLLQELTQDNNTKTKKCLIEALSRLDFKAVKEDLLSLFEQGKAKEMKYISKILLEHIYEIDKNRIYRLYQKSPHKCVRIQAAMLLCSLRKWERIIYIIEFCANKDGNINKIGKDTLREWRIGYESPPKGTIESLQNLYAFYFNGFDEWTKNKLKDIFTDIYKYYVK